MLLSYENKTFRVEAKKIENKIIYDINGEKFSLLFRAINDNTIAIFKDDGYSNAYFCEDENNIYISYHGFNYTFNKIDEEEKSFDSSDINPTDKLIVKPPMPGCIVKVEVKIGDKVVEGTALLIIEAMKMETCIYSTINGIVTEVNVSVGEQVDTDKILMKVEKVIDN